jgi:hypothetical protein
MKSTNHFSSCLIALLFGVNLGTLVPNASAAIVNLNVSSISGIKFLSGELIGESVRSSDGIGSTAFSATFENVSDTSPDFGAGSYLGFVSQDGNAGWLEVTWDSASREFQILSGAFESEPGVGILAGATAIPEPSSALLALTGSAMSVQAQAAVLTCQS